LSVTLLRLAITHSKKAMTMVTFLCYLSSSGDDETERWYRRQSTSVQAAIYAVLETLRHRPPDRWRRKPFARLNSCLCTGLAEIRVEEPDGMHYRILGYFDDERTIFTLLYAFRKDDDPGYNFACPEAQRRRRATETNPDRTTLCGIGGW
jgi:hypothetical protein